MDWNSDGQMDIVSGDREGYFNVFIARDSELMGYKQYKLMDSTVLDVGYNSQPAVVDWNGDGKKDLLLGTEGGIIQRYLNQTSDSWPMFQTYDTVCAGGTPGVPIVLNRVNPYVFDLDRDGVRDLICGANDGYIRFYRNIGSNEAPILAAAETLRLLDERPIQPPGTVSGSRCGFGYWDSDTLPDFLLSGLDGTVALFRGAELTAIEHARTPRVPGLPALEVTPNPARGAVRFSVSPALLPAGPVLDIYNAAGNLVISRPVMASSFVLGASSLPAGVYLCRLDAAGQAVSRRLVVSR